MAKDEDKEPEVEEKGEKPSKKGEKPKLAHVHGADGRHINTYSSADSEDYQERAERVALKHGGSVKHE